MQRPLSRRARQAAIAAALVLGLAGCGGGGVLGFGDFGDFGDSPPDVSLTSNPSSVAPGQTLKLLASASDDFGVRRVNFFVLQAGVYVSLGTDSAAPYELDTQVALDAVGTLQFVARARDFDGVMSAAVRGS